MLVARRRPHGWRPGALVLALALALPLATTTAAAAEVEPTTPPAAVGPVGEGTGDVPEVVVEELDVVAPPDAEPPATPSASPSPSASPDALVLDAAPDDRAVSDVVEPASDFQTVALTWPVGTDPTGLDPQVRTRGDDGWGPWVPLEVDATEADAGSVDARHEKRGGTPSLWVGQSEAVQLSVAADAAEDLPDLRLAVVGSELVEPDVAASLEGGTGGVAGGARGASVPATGPAAAAASAPAIVTRAAWGARAQACAPDVASRLVGVVVHHTAGSNAYASPAEAAAQIRNDQRYHIESRGWCDIGYNFLVDRWGNIYEGRAGSMTSPVVGVHAGGFNTATVGISMLGTFGTVAPPAAMTDAVARIAAWRLAAYGVDPRGSMTYTTGGGENSRFPNGGTVPLPVVFGHRDVAFTSCPGDQGWAALGTVRAVAGRYWDGWSDWHAGPSVSPQMRYLWDRTGGPSGPLGVPLAGQRCDLSPAGCVQQFSGASVYWSAATGAQAVGGLLLNRWLASGGPAAGIGYPTTTVFGCPASGCVQRFQSGSIAWSAATGAHLVGGAIHGRFTAAGGVSALGYPTSTVLACDGAAGCRQTFERASITWSGATGAHAIGGIIASTWSAQGGAEGPLGYPASSVLACDPGAGCTQRFRGGAISWSGATGAAAMGEAVAAEWLDRGGPASVGYPTRSVLACEAAACEQPFARGTAVWPRGGEARLVGGLLEKAWRGAGGAARLGVPTTTVLACDPGAGCTQWFTDGAVSWSSSTGAHVVPGALSTRWREIGGPAATGLPTQSLTSCPATGACVQQLQRATLVSSRATGVHAVGGIIGATWRGQGGVNGALGLPTSTVLACDPGAGCTQRFERGTISWSAAAGTRVTRY